MLLEYIRKYKRMKNAIRIIVPVNMHEKLNMKFLNTFDVDPK